MTQSEQAFKGRLITALPDYIPRDEQIQMANAIEKSIGKKGHLIVEAGTGTGKTFAYLIPSLLTNKKTIVATGTKTLQDQLFHKDIPVLIKALGLSSKIQLLKGRANYLCRYRIEINSQSAQFPTAEVADEFQSIKAALPRVQMGDVNEFTNISDDSFVWPFVTSTTENCLGAECDYFDDCFLVKARRKSMTADVLVINHHLYFSDTLLKDEGFGELLPGAEVIIFDEAHQLPELAAHFYGTRLSSRQLTELMRDICAEMSEFNDNQLLIDVAKSIELLIIKFKRQLDSMESRTPWHDVMRNKPAKQAFDYLQSGLTEIHGIFESESERSKGLNQCFSRLVEFISQLNQFNNNTDDSIQWLEHFKSSFILHVTPASVAESFSYHMQQNGASYVFTSATLAVDGHFNHFCQPLGLTVFDELIVDSPFDYQKQALLYMPRGMPDPKALNYIDSLIDNVLPILTALQGRSFLLFTSYNALNLAAEKLSKLNDFNLLVQGQETNRVLLQRFKQSDNAVLLGTASFWEGVDVKGRDLSCVVIDKLPFASPFDPVIKAKIQMLKRKGLRAFDEFQLPHAIVTLKQGVGRLIRGEEDRGILVIGDPRFYARAYGQRFINSLPAMTLTRSSRSVLEFAQNLFVSDEEKNEIYEENTVSD